MCIIEHECCQAKLRNSTVESQLGRVDMDGHVSGRAWQGNETARTSGRPGCSGSEEPSTHLTSRYYADIKGHSYRGGSYAIAISSENDFLELF